MTDVTGTYPGRPTFQLLLRVTGSYPTGQAELYAINTTGTSSTFYLNNLPFSVYVSGNYYTGEHNLDFRGGQYSILLGAFPVALAAGNNPFSASHGGGDVFGVAVTSTGTHVSASVPPAPDINCFSPNPDQITTTSMRVRFCSTGTGGSPITSWTLQRALDPLFTVGVVSYASTGTSVITDLDPGTRYYWRAAGNNASGRGAWSSTVSGTTISVTAPGMTVTPGLSGTTASVALTPPAGGGVTSYRVERRLASGGAATVYNTVTSPLAVTGLTPGTAYEWRASAFIGSYQTNWTAWVPVVQPQPNTNPGDYFDGSTAARPDTTFQWDGTVNNSVSRGVSKAPAGWRTFAQGSAASGGAGEVIQVSGGRSGSRAARVLFFSDAVTAGFRGGTAFAQPGLSEVAERGIYWGSIYVQPSRSQRMAAEITWFNAAFAQVGSPSIGDAVVVGSSSLQRLIVQGTAPVGAVWASVGWRDVAGAGWSQWLGGQTVTMDDAMLSIGQLFDWFSGSSAPTSNWSYSWMGAANASVSIATAVAPGVNDPLADPDCPPLPLPPAPPPISDDCIDEVGAWRRYWAVVPADQVSNWLDLVPTIQVTSGSVAARQVRIRVWRNPDSASPDDFESSSWDAEQIISYMPPRTVLTLDGVARRVWASVDGGDLLQADRLLYGTGGGPASWPVLSCGIAYLISFDVPLDAPEGNIAVGVSLTTRML